MQGTDEPKIMSLPAKRDGLFAAAASLIARSDSNGEDLEGFAGAGKKTSLSNGMRLGGGFHSNACIFKSNAVFVADRRDLATME